MKKIILAVTVLFSVIATAQEFGIKAGANLSSLSGDYGKETKLKPGIYAGVFAEFDFIEKMSIQAELLYSQQGVDNKKSYLDRDLNFLSLPITYNYYLIDKIKVSAGLQLNYLIDAKDKTNFKDFDTTLPSGFYPNGEFKSTDKYNKLSTDFVIGASYNIWKGIYVDARYVFGVSKINKDIYDVEKGPIFSDVDGDANLKNRNIQLGLSYKF